MSSGIVVPRLVCKECGRELNAADQGKPCPSCGSTASEWTQEYDESVAFRRGACG